MHYDYDNDKKQDTKSVLKSGQFLTSSLQPSSPTLSKGSLETFALDFEIFFASLISCFRIIASCFSQA